MEDVTFDQEELEETVNQEEESNDISNYKDPIFNPVPLSERISSGVESFYDTILRQKVLAREAAAQAYASGSLPPEIRLGTIS